MQSRNVSMGLPSKFEGVIPFYAQTQLQQEDFLITGITRDSDGEALGTARVLLFNTATNIFWASTTSDPVGNYAFHVSPGDEYFAVAYKVGMGDVAGMTDVEGISDIAGTTENGLTNSYVPFDYDTISGCQLWAKADSLLGSVSNNDRIASWPDSSGNGNTFTQNNDTRQPTLKTNILNDLPMVHLTGLNSFFSSSASAAQKPVTIFIVAKLNNLQGVNTNLLTSNNPSINLGFNIRVGPTGTIILARGATAIATSTTIGLSTTDAAIVEVTYGSAGEYAILSNGAPIINEGVNDLTSLAATRQIGFLATSVDGDVAEILQYDSVLSASERSAVRRYLGRKYNITVTI